MEEERLHDDGRLHWATRCGRSCDGTSSRMNVKVGESRNTFSMQEIKCNKASHITIR